MTDVFFKLNYFKTKISTILKRHCCHRNDSRVTFVKEFQVFITMLYYIKKAFFAFKQVIIFQTYG